METRAPRHPEPTPTIESQISAKRDEIKGYKSGGVTRPQPKSAYMELLAQLNAELNALNEQNQNINDANRAARPAVDDQYTADIEAFKAVEENKWTAFGEVVSEVLNQSAWMMLEDSQLDVGQKDVGKTYRQTMMDLKKNHLTVAEAIANVPINPYQKIW